MHRRGFSQNIVIAIVGLIVIAGAFFLVGKDTPQNVGPLPSENSGEVATTTDKPTTSPPTSPAPSSVKPTPKPATKPVTPPASSGGMGSGSGTVTIPVIPSPQPTAPPPPATVTEPVPAPATWSPGFQEVKRTYAAIPSEKERATLPSCDGKTFTIAPVDLSPVASISASASPAEYETFTMKSKGLYDIYDFTFPADVYVTTVVQENGISADPEDSTVYFALCKDVIGYVTHVKELSAQVYKFVTDSNCLGKAHTGPNACRIEILTLVGRGSPIGKVGRYEGAFGFGVIDLRKPRGLANPAQYADPIRKEFAACPFDYFGDSGTFYTKLAQGDALCTSR